MASDKKEKKEKKEKKLKKEKKEKKEKRSRDEGADAKADKKAKKAKKEAPNANKSEGTMSADEYRALHEVTSEGQQLPAPFQTFDMLPFGSTVSKKLNELYPGPTPIQAQGWPIIIAGNDMVAVAKTGSGKTLGFLLPAFQQIQQDKSKSKGPKALVLAPTRELAMQIAGECDKFVSLFGISCVCVYGGVPKPPQQKLLQANPEMVIATPGRLTDFLSMGLHWFGLGDVKYLVLDEADRMLDMGFEPQITKIIGETASVEDRQTVFFSATWPKSVKKMAAKYLKKGEELTRVTIGSTEELVANTAISQQFYELDDSEKDAALWKIITELPDNSKVVTFANTKRRIDYLASACWQEGFGASAIHGGKTQGERDEGLKQFAEGKWPLMFATDVAARGLDIKGVTHVINFDMPRDVEQYVHRIGRTGRAGASGAAITFWNKSYDIPCAPALAKIAREAGKEVPGWLEKWAQKSKMQKGDKNWKI
jgi:superfamily II DNA/RNA helicase